MELPNNCYGQWESEHPGVPGTERVIAIYQIVEHGHSVFVGREKTLKKARRRAAMTKGVSCRP